jgi:hypothetical protein
MFRWQSDHTSLAAQLPGSVSELREEVSSRCYSLISVPQQRRSIFRVGGGASDRLILLADYFDQACDLVTAFLRTLHVGYFGEKLNFPLEIYKYLFARPVVTKQVAPLAAATWAARQCAVIRGLISILMHDCDCQPPPPDVEVHYYFRPDQLGHDLRRLSA